LGGGWFAEGRLEISPLSERSVSYKKRIKVFAEGYQEEEEQMWEKCRLRERERERKRTLYREHRKRRSVAIAF
jgi:hypothetical protein